MRIAFIGFGEAARSFQASLSQRDPTLGFAAYDIDGSHGMREAMASAGMEPAGSSQDAIAGADLVFSAVTADQASVAALKAAEGLAAGQVFIDINSVSPQRKRDNAAAVDSTGATYIDMAVMAPVHPRGHATPVLIAGPDVEGLSKIFNDLGFAFEVVGEAVGSATAIKMVRSLFVKGLEAITVECLLAAAASGCFDDILASLSKSYPGLEWPRIAEYHFERSTRHGKRRAAEMMESGATLDELGLSGGLAREIAGVQDRMGGLSAEGDTLAVLVRQLLSQRLGRQEG
jgi:3-hydroxyisobutyrate dehydrogenase-like beta-hydroxyacid dehydrogenase